MTEHKPSELLADEMTGPEVARYLGVTRQFVSKAANAGALPGRQLFGRYWVFKLCDVRAFATREKSPRGGPHKKQDN